MRSGSGSGESRPESARPRTAALAVLPYALFLAMAGISWNRWIEPYVDYEWAPGGADKATYKVFAGYEFKKAALGAEVVDRVNHAATGGNKEPKFAWNLGERMGLSGRASLLPLAVFVALAGAWVAVLVARRDRQECDVRAQ